MANACGACQFRIVGLHAFPPAEPNRAIQIQGTDMHRRSRGTIRPRLASKFCPSKREGAGNAGCALHPRSRVQCAQKGAHTSIQGSGGNPTFPAQWLYGLYRALPGDRALWSPSPPRSLLLENLTPASRRQNHTTSPYASAPFVKGASASTAPCPTFVTMADAPLLGTGWQLMCP